MTSTWQRWLDLVDPLERRLTGTWPTVLIGTSAVLVLLLAGLPFGLWYGYGPARFGSLDLGGDPEVVGLPDQPEAVGAPGSPSAATSDRLAPDIPLDLGPDVRVTLVFSVGSRELSAEDADRLRINDADTRGEDGLTDVLMLVLADPVTGKVALFSLPRDLHLQSRGSRINATWVRHGTQALVDDVVLVTGLPIHHVVQVNFTAFAELVDRLGGVAMATDRALADFASVLYVPGPGCWRFDGADALGYVRSRKTLTRTDDGRWVGDPASSDFGRIARQQQLLRAAFQQLRGPQLVRRAPDLLQVARGGLVVDQGLGLNQVRGLASAFADVSAGGFEGFTVPTTGRTIRGASVLVPLQDEVRPIMQRLRSWPPDDEPTTDAHRLGGTPGRPLAAAVDTAAAEDACTLATAAELPDPRAELARLNDSGSATSRRPSGDDEPVGSSRGSVGDDAEQPTSEPTDEPSDGRDATPAPTDRPTEQPPSEQPSGEPSDEPTEDPSPSPSEDPSEEPSDDDGIIPLPGP